MVEAGCALCLALKPFQISHNTTATLRLYLELSGELTMCEEFAACRRASLLELGVGCSAADKSSANAKYTGHSAARGGVHGVCEVRAWSVHATCVHERDKHVGWGVHAGVEPGEVHT